MEWVMLICVIIVFILFFYLKEIIWNRPHLEIERLRKQIQREENEHSAEIQKIKAECKKQVERTEDNCRTEIFRIHEECKRQVELTEDNCHEKIFRTQEEYNKKHEALKVFESNLSAIPYMAGMIADIETYGLEKLALGLSWGRSQKRLDKVKSIREIRKDAQAMVEKNKEAQYQLAYLLELYPNLADIIECEFSQLPIVEVNELSDYDATRDYLSKEEYASLSITERNQLALDRYMNSHNKTKWQIGRDYEQYVGYKYREKGYEVDDFGSYMGLEDLGRDIIAKKGNTILIIQCKYWSSVKQIHEKHITQLYGTMVSYCFENNIIDKQKVKGVLITNIQLSEMAKKMANYLGIEYKENYQMGKYPCIKCNLGHSEWGESRIYHLPFDKQYDVTKISKKGEFYAMSVAEAEAAGFRRAFKWFGSK